MTLQEKIQKKAEGYGKLASVFLEGAKFALENQWISVDDDLPCYHEELLEDYNYETVAVIVKYRYSTYPSSDYMRRDKGNWVWVRNCGITHWMPIPKPPKE